MTVEARASLRRLATLLRKADSSAECRRVSEQLPLFVSDELAGYPVDELYPETAMHVELCRRCLEEYVALSSMLGAALYGDDADE